MCIASLHIISTSKRDRHIFFIIPGCLVPSFPKVNGSGGTILSFILICCVRAVPRKVLIANLDYYDKFV